MGLPPFIYPNGMNSTTLKHGAIQEAYHVFIKMGLDLFSEELSILEIGFGTGLNAMITLLEQQKRSLSIDYVGVEGYPVANNEVQKLNYVSELKAEQYQEDFEKLHSVSWGDCA